MSLKIIKNNKHLAVPLVQVMLEVQPVAIIAQNKSYLSVNEQQRIAD
jgi:hypothetical protein